MLNTILIVLRPSLYLVGMNKSPWKISPCVSSWAYFSEACASQNPAKGSTVLGVPAESLEAAWRRASNDRIQFAQKMRRFEQIHRWL
jgi:myo-inositol catabolism protein IolC